jgi:hypothetical protein
MSSLPPVRRVVTAHDPASGKSIVASDLSLIPANPLDPAGAPPEGIIPGFTNIFKTVGHPAANVQGSWYDVHGKKIGLVDESGVACRIVDCEFSTVLDGIATFLSWGIVFGNTCCRWEKKEIMDSESRRFSTGSFG